MERFFVAARLCVASIAVLLAAGSLRASEGAMAQFTFFDFNAPKAKAVNGVRFPAIYGKGGGDIVGLDFGLLAYSEMNSLRGVAWSVFPHANRIRNGMTGAAFGLFNWHEGEDIGVNFGVVNITNNVRGLNWSAVNFAKGHTVADVGVVNVSDSSNFQLSFVNITQRIEGLQLGLLNCASNGFLPCFVLFNFGK